PLTDDERPDGWLTLRRYWPFLLPVIVLLVALFGLRWSPEKAAFVSLLGALLATVIVGEKKLKLKLLINIFEGTGKSLLEIIAITAAAGIIVGVLSITGLTFALGLSIANLAGPLPF